MSKTAVLVALLTFAIMQNSFAKEQFLISHWCGPTEATQEKFAEAAEAGFNVVMFEGKTVEQNLKALDLAQANGMKMLVADGRPAALSSRSPEFRSNLDAVLSDYSGHPALWGYFVKDEPNADLFVRLGAVNKYLLSKDPERIPFVNLFPTYANADQLGHAEYEHYVDEYLRVVRPRLLSYDHYALFDKSTRPDYFQNLEIIRRQGIKHHTPFSYILLSVPHGPYRAPSDTDLRWQVNTALAYGARGVMYFTYTTPHDDAWNFRDAIIDQNGKRNRKFDEVKKINGELRMLAPTLMKLNSVAVYHTAPVPAGAKELPDDGLISIEGGEFLVGQFNSDDGGRYAMFVNRSLDKSARAQMSFRGRVVLSEVSRASGRTRALAVTESGDSTLWSPRFAPGEGRLVKIDALQDGPLARWEDLLCFRPRVMLNPSAQFANVIPGEKEGDPQLYNEGMNMYNVALKVYDELRRDGRVDVFISRDSQEQRTTLGQETELTRSLNCDVLVSLHSDAMPGNDTTAGGTWTFYADDVEGKRLAECVQMPLLETIQEFHPDVTFRGVRTHFNRLWVLHESGCPASLTEVLFHTNPKEREMLKDPACQEKIAKAVAKGILDYFGLK